MQLVNLVKEKWRNILVLIGWTTVITLMTLVTEYVKSPPGGLSGTSFSTLDLAIVLVASLVFGIFLIDPIRIPYCVMGTISLSIVISVIYSALYDLSLGAAEYFSEAVPGWEWEWVTWFAFLRIFRIMFPAAIIVIFIGGMIGGIVSELFWPHRGY